MKVRVIVALAGALTLAGCSSQTTGTPTSGTSSSAATSSSAPTSSSATSSADAVTTTSAAPASPAAAPAPGETPPREFVIGKWGTDGDCEMAVDLRADVGLLLTLSAHHRASLNLRPSNLAPHNAPSIRFNLRCTMV